MGQTFPLGNSDFRRIRENDRLYIDKTQTIELMENTSDFITFLRPRRFGKSLLVSTLFYYYDLKSAKLFKTLYGDLFIGQHPTNEMNSFYVLNLNFSDLSIEENFSIESSFRSMIFYQLKKFVKYYAPLNKQQEFFNIFEKNEPINIIFKEIVDNIAELTDDGKVYVLIDEYDHFTNRMIFSNLQNDYRSAVQSSGYIRQFFTTLKGLTSGSVKRIFITGILPILLNDVTSGYNIDTKVTKKSSYQGSMGFTDIEVENLLKSQNMYSEELHLKIKELYNGFMFADAPKLNNPKVYNCQMVLSFIDSVSETKIIPKDIIDSTFLSDKNKFEFFKSNPKNIKKILQILESEVFVSTYNQVIKIDDIPNPINLTTLLFHFGLLTFQEYTSSSVIYKIPNIAMRELYYEYFKEYLQDNSSGFENIQNIYDITKALTQHGDLQPLITYMQDEILSSFSFREPINLDEKSLKFLLIMFFKFTPYYETHSEQEQVASANQGGYSDLILTKLREDVKYEWVFELKYVKFGDLHLKKQSGKAIPKNTILEHALVKENMLEGRNQLSRYKIVYEKKYRISSDTTQMRYAVIVFIGKEFILFEEI